ncbi:MAG: c-type cytochrome, partial [Gemmatimonadaceae bacterium]
MHADEDMNIASATGRFPRLRQFALLAGMCASMLVVACEKQATPAPDATPSTSPPSAPAIVQGKGGPEFVSTVTTTVGGRPWRPPAETEIGTDSMGQSIRRGLSLIRHFTDSLPDYASGHISCTNCHLQDGRSRYGSPLVGAYARYPKYIARSAAVVTMADRINFCITRSLAGNRLSSDSREMADMTAYLAWLSKGLPLGATTPGSDGLPRLKAASTPDPIQGAQLYAAKCQTCHQASGGGAVVVGATSIPALWGAQSYSVGASMARVERAASFIAHNMPLGLAGTLTTQEAFDVAAYVNSHARPDLPGKEYDWPAGDAPADLPYSTKSGHTAVNPPLLLPRKVPARTLVPPP